MNLNILKPEVQHFIEKNRYTPVTNIALATSPFEGITAQELAQQVDGKQRLARKIPEWAMLSGIYYPQRRSLEQCSSDHTANYKAHLIKGGTVLDMTGGMGVDTWSIAKHAEQVVYCEQDKALFDMTSHNFSVLKANNIQPIYGDAIAFLRECEQSWHTIYLDPARRDNYNRKMVSFSDCQPNVIEQLPLLWTHTSHILIKASPMMDITKAISELESVKQVHIVSVKNECKELLFLLEKGYNGKVEFVAANLGQAQPVFSFFAAEEVDATPQFSLPKRYIYEPNTSVLKSGAFKLLAVRYGINKLHHFTHIYTADDCIPNFSGQIYCVKAVCDYNKKQLKKALLEKRANVKCFNFVDKPAVLQKKLQLKDGGSVFLFGVKNSEEKYQVIVCEKI